MSHLPLPLKAALDEKLADSMDARQALPEFTPRQLFGAVQIAGKVSAVIGMRRAGKTTFLHQLRSERLARGVPRAYLPYINFEDERLAGLRAAQLGYLVEEHERQLPESRRRPRVTWCFDEIQVVTGWERFVRRLLDAGDNELFITGSSAALLSREIATAMRGRAWEVLIHPFSFKEALRHDGHRVPTKSASLPPRERGRIERAFKNWLGVGGFPEVQSLDTASRHRLLRDYVDVAMFRDVVERHGTRNVAGLRLLVRHILGNAASTFSVEKFHASLKSQGFAIARDTVHQLLAQLEDCFLVRTLWMEASSERQRMVNPRKVYPVDTGLIPIFDRSGRANTGHALETAVLIELERRRAEVTYLRTPSGLEVDFLARHEDGKMELIQVCADASAPDTAERELRALSEAHETFPKARRLLLTLTRNGLPSDAPKGVRAQPAYEWLLERWADR